MEVVLRSEAITRGLARYFTGAPCRHGHISERNTKNRECIQCALARSARDPRKAERTLASSRRNKVKRAEYQRERYWRDPFTSREYNRAWRESNIGVCLERERRYHEENKEARAEYARLRYLEHKDEVRAATIKWEKENPHKVAAKTARRKAAKLRATPAWADQESIVAFYKEARRMTEETGIPHEVDHIHPLQGENFCGLHVPWNLQILTKSENSSKKNKLIDAALKETA